MNNYTKLLRNRDGQKMSSCLVRRCGMIRSSCFTKSNDMNFTSNYWRYNSTTKQSLRRPRQYVGPIKAEGGNMPTFIHRGLDEPYEHQEESLEKYLKKTSLSPWTPIPDVVARKMFDMANAGPDDIHVDLGSGDGRVNFHAIDYYKVKQSIGIDVDESIVAVAQERLKKRHPQPTNIQFIVADLLDPSHSLWNEIIQKATIITMYFATDGLKLFRPLLENKLVGHIPCRILTCGYEMPGWNSINQEVVLGTQIHMYQWGDTSSSIDDDDDFELFATVDDSILHNPPEELVNREGSNKLQGLQVIDHTGKYPIRGFNPKLFLEEEKDDDEWETSSDDEEAGKSDKK